MRKISMLTLSLAIVLMAIPFSQASDFMVYSVYKSVDLGNPGEVSQKDFYVNMGTSNGLKTGTKLKVYRMVSTFDVTSQKLYKDMSFPIGTIKVIHAESNAAIARLDDIESPEKTPATTRAVMVGDKVEISRD